MTNLGMSSINPRKSPEGVRQHTEAVQQLSMLSSVLNGLESGASAMCRHAHEAMRAVRDGSYRVDAMQLSRRIVGEAMGLAY